MQKNLTELVFILDKSGSMHGSTADTIGGFNSMIDNQKKQDGKALVSTILFSSKSHLLHDRKDLNEIEKLTDRDYVAGGSTALYDAIGNAIQHIKTIHKYAREEDRPEKTMFVITTDGYENASKEYTREKVQTLIKEQEEKGWQFIFVAANINAEEVGTSIGIDVNFCSDYSANDVRSSYYMMDMAIADYRSAGRVRRNWKNNTKPTDENK